MIRLLTAPIALLLLSASSASAAPRPDEKPSGPPIIGQAKSFNELIDMAKTMVKSIAGSEVAKQFENGILKELDPKQLPGIDPKRPFGLYGIVHAKIEDCRGVVLIPVPSEAEFTQMLSNHRIEFAKSEKDAGTFDVKTPEDFPIHVSFRVHQGYAYLAFGGSDVIAAKTILEPGDVINDKEKSVALLSLKLDRIPAEVKKAMLGLIRDNVETLKEQIPEPELKEAFHSLEKLGLRYIKMLFEEAKSLSIRVDADVKTGEMFADITVEPLSKSSLAETFAKRKPNLNAFASLAGDDYAQRLFITGPLFAEEAKEGFGKLIDWGSKEAVKNLARGQEPAEVINFVEAIFRSLKATVDTGEFDLAAALRGPNKEGFHTAVAALHCAETAQLEKAIKDAVKILPERERNFFKFEAAQINKLNVHEIDLSAEADEIAQKIFGKAQTVYFAFGKNALYASYGPDGMKLLKEAIESKPGPAAALDTASNPKKLKDIMDKLIPADDKRARREFGWLESVASGLKISVDGGEKLRIRVSYNVGLLLKYVLLADAEGNR